MADEETEPQPVWKGPLDEDGLPHGQGKMTYVAPPPASEEEEAKPADTFVGAMEHGVRHGRGTYTFGASGAAYDGDYVQGVRQGRGSIRFPDGGKYEGGWAADKMEGQGTYTYKCGDMFCGGFKGGKKEGAGVYHCKADGAQYHGTWVDGDMVEGRFMHRDGSMFAGTFEASKPAQGTHFFTGSGLLQSGSYSAHGAWHGGAVEAGSATMLPS